MSRTQVSPGTHLPNRIAGAAEVCRTSTVEGVVDKDRNLEVDTLTDGKPVELIPQHRSDMVELPPVRDKPGCSIKDGLQSSYVNDYRIVQFYREPYRSIMHSNDSARFNQVSADPGACHSLLLTTSNCLEVGQ